VAQILHQNTDLSDKIAEEYQTPSEKLKKDPIMALVTKTVSTYMLIRHSKNGKANTKMEDFPRGENHFSKRSESNSYSKDKSINPKSESKSESKNVEVKKENKKSDIFNRCKSKGDSEGRRSESHKKDPNRIQDGNKETAR
jgi:hypothetical protein